MKALATSQIEIGGRGGDWSPEGKARIAKSDYTGRACLLRVRPSLHQEGQLEPEQKTAGASGKRENGKLRCGSWKLSREPQEQPQRGSSRIWVQILT